MKEKSMVTELPETFPTLIIDKRIADIAAEMRKKYRVKLPDAFQAAFAKENSLILVTRNTKDFSAGMNFVEIPYILEPA